MNELACILREFPNEHVLLYGPPGTGKSYQASKLAQGRHALMINASKKRTVDVVRGEIKDFSRNEGALIILDEADNMTPQAISALLRIIEKSVAQFVVVCNNKYEIGIPMLSRLTRVYFAPLDDDALKAIIKSEHKSGKFTSECLDGICRLSRGDVRVALKLSVICIHVMRGKYASKTLEYFAGELQPGMAKKLLEMKPVDAAAHIEGMALPMDRLVDELADLQLKAMDEGAANHMMKLCDADRSISQGTSGCAALLHFFTSVAK